MDDEGVLIGESILIT